MSLQIISNSVDTYSSLAFFSPSCTLLPYLWGQNIYCRCITQGCLSTVLLLYSGVSPTKSQTMKAWCYWNEMEMKQQQTPLCPATFANTDLEKGANVSRGLQIHKGLQASAIPFRQVFCPTLWLFLSVETTFCVMKPPNYICGQGNLAMQAPRLFISSRFQGWYSSSDCFKFNPGSYWWQWGSGWRVTSTEKHDAKLIRTKEKKKKKKREAGGED